MGEVDRRFSYGFSEGFFGTPEVLRSEGGAGWVYIRVMEVALSEAARPPFPDMANPAANLSAVRETMEVLFEISKILNTGLDMETLSICVRLCEQGINPEALSAVIKELRKATEALKAAENMTS